MYPEITKEFEHFGEEDHDLLDELVGVILSQNTSNNNSSRAFTMLKLTFPTWHDVATAPTADVAASIAIAGLSATKAPRIQEILNYLYATHKEYSLQFLRTYTPADAIAYLTSFRGVGIKTAACVLLFGLKKNICPVDTHVHRILNRLGAVKTTTPEATFEILQTTEYQELGILHVGLITHGRQICTARVPRCNDCAIRALCSYYGTTEHDK